MVMLGTRTLQYCSVLLLSTRPECEPGGSVRIAYASTNPTGH